MCPEIRGWAHFENFRNDTKITYLCLPSKFSPLFIWLLTFYWRLYALLNNCAVSATILASKGFAGYFEIIWVNRIMAVVSNANNAGKLLLGVEKP